MTLQKAIKTAFAEGWIDNLDDPWADMICFGGYIDEDHCYSCPLLDHCEAEAIRSNTE